MRTGARGRKITAVQRRSFVVAIALGLVAAPLVVGAQPRGKTWRVGFLSGGARPPDGAPPLPLRQALRDLGYVEPQNVVYLGRWADAKQERLPGLAAELVELKVDVIVTVGGPASAAAKQATSSIPIVLALVGDADGIGLIESLARPGGNVTGITDQSADLSAKRLELLTEVLQKKFRVAVLWELDAPGPKIAFEEYNAAASLMNLQLQSAAVRGPTPDFDVVFKAAVNGHAQALLTIRNPLLARYSKDIADLAIKNRLPSMCEEGLYVEAGCLMSYAASDSGRWQRAAVYVDKILKGAKPADLPIEQPTKFEFVINLKTAKQIGLTIPPNVLARADKVIR